MKFLTDAKPSTLAEDIVNDFVRKLDSGEVSHADGPAILEQTLRDNYDQIMAEANLPGDWELRTMPISPKEYVEILDEMIEGEIHWLARTMLQHKGSGGLFIRGLYIISPKGLDMIQEFGEEAEIRLAEVEAKKETKH